MLAAVAATLGLLSVGYAQNEENAVAPDAETHTTRGQIPAPQDVTYPGTLSLKVDLTDVERRVFNVHESIPVKPGPLTLFYPQWLPGHHAPRGPIEALAGLTMTVSGHPLDWARDPVNVYAFHLEVPPGASRLDLEFQLASPLLKDQGRSMMTPDMAGLQWNAVVLYPAGYYVSRMTVAAAIVLPEGWQFAGALDVDGQRGNVVRFKPISLEMLVDSPVFAGRYVASVDLDPGARASVHLDLFADGPEALEAKAAQIAAHRKLVREAYAFFGAPHYGRYEFLLALSEPFGDIGLEHQRSSENRRTPGYFSDWDRTAVGRELLPHEFSHSWNGKFRRPAGLATPDFNTPMRDDLLWVYEGLTDYVAVILATRSGLWSEDFARQGLASVAASMDRDRPGRVWRDLQDTTEQPIITARRPLSWLSWQRTEDYYTEGELLWLDVDTHIRELTGDKRSLDDFARAFFGVVASSGSEPGFPEPVTYTLADVTRALKAIAPFDWDTFFAQRLHAHGSAAALDGLTRGGWKLVYAETPSDYVKSLEDQRKSFDFTYSLGLSVSSLTSQLTDVRWGGPAYDAGLTIATTLIAVDGREFRVERLAAAITAAKAGQPVELLVKNLDRYKTVRIAYTEGLKYPVLQRINQTQDRLGAILKPRT
jgi:predicted metalloprotease with PDZ domain